MTNREYLIMALQEKLDDFGAEESVIVYNIDCPYYFHNPKSKCNRITEPDRWEHCRDCKYEWLDSEVEE